MGLLDKFKTQTIEEAVDTARESVTKIVKTGVSEKMNGLLMLVPMVVALGLIFKGDKGAFEDTPSRVVNNYYYCCPGRRKENAAHAHQMRK